MTPAEAAAVLALCAAFDNRTSSEAAARAWAEALPEVRADDAMTAVRQHYRASTAFLMPATVRALVRALRDERLARIPIPPPPADIVDDGAASIEWDRRWRKAIGDGMVTEADATSGLPARDMGFLEGVFPRVPAIGGASS